MKAYHVLFFSVFVILLSVFATGGSQITIESMPPVVVRTLPQSGDDAIDPGIGEIKVTFSKHMMTKKMWSWVKITDDTFPQMTGDPYYLNDNRTCVLPVKLEPGKTYAIWINSEKFNAFRDIKGNPAVAYLLIFKTK